MRGERGDSGFLTADPVAAAPVAPIQSRGSAASPQCESESQDTVAVNRRDACVVGRFEVLRCHAKGGIGEVLLARDRELNRDVALKELRIELALDKVSQARFKREAEITAGLEHPGIVPVYERGFYGDGRPYYAMQFIRGERFTDAIKKYHEDRDSTRSGNFEFRQLLHRFVSACETVAYAHSRGVLHRDIKPDNIMIGRFGRTLIVDWGLAKRMTPDDNTPRAQASPQRRSMSADIAETAVGTLTGTLAFMSPEQASGLQLDTRSDVYSLGATLYCILTGLPPFIARKGTNTLREVIEGRFERPSIHLRNVPSTLEAICLKAMANRPEDRYRSASDLSDDIARFLADEPTIAARETASMRSRRWLRKHPTIASGCIIATVAMIFFLIIQTETQRRAHDRLVSAERRAAKHAEVAVRNSERAERSEKAAWLQARCNLNSLQFVVRKVNRELDRWPNTVALRRELMSNLSEHFRSNSMTAAQLPNREIIETQMALQMELVVSCEDLGDYKSSEKQLNELHRIAEEQATLYPDDISRSNLAKILLALANTKLETEFNSRACIKLQLQALEVVNQIVEHPMRVSQGPSEVDIIGLHGLVQHQLATTYLTCGMPLVAHHHFEQSVEIHDLLVGRLAELPDDAVRIAEFETNLQRSSVGYGITSVHLGDTEEGLRLCRDALQRLRHSVNANGASIRGRFSYAALASRFGETLRDLGKLTESDAYLSEADTIFRVLSACSDSVSLKREHARTQFRLAISAKQLGDESRASTLLGECVRTQKQLLRRHETHGLKAQLLLTHSCLGDSTEAWRLMRSIDNGSPEPCRDIVLAKCYTQLAQHTTSASERNELLKLREASLRSARACGFEDSFVATRDSLLSLPAADQ